MVAYIMKRIYYNAFIYLLIGGFELEYDYISEIEADISKFIIKHGL